MERSKGLRVAEKGSGLGQFARTASGLVVPNEVALSIQQEQHRKMIERNEKLAEKGEYHFKQEKGITVAHTVHETGTKKSTPRAQRRKTEKAKRAARRKNRA